MSTYKKSKETREKILEFAKKTFYELGFQKTTIRNITGKAGMNHALAYYHFNGKYDLAHQIIDEYHQKMETLFNEMVKENLDPLLKLLVLYRFDLREIYENKRDFDFYVSVYQESYYDQDFVRDCTEIGEYYNMNFALKKIEIAAIATSTSWGQLYTNKEVPYEGHFSHRDILDAIDIMRWAYLGFTNDFIVEKIEKAYQILETLPMVNIPLLSLEDETEK
ncbi:HTH-type transcriptional regulator TtgR [anaerobic digester metagenome]